MGRDKNSLCSPCAAVEATVGSISGRGTGSGTSRGGARESSRARDRRGRAGDVGATGATVRLHLPPHMGRNVGTGAITVEIEAVHVQLVSHDCEL